MVGRRARAAILLKDQKSRENQAAPERTAGDENESNGQCWRPPFVVAGNIGTSRRLTGPLQGPVDHKNRWSKRRPSHAASIDTFGAGDRGVVKASGRPRPYVPDMTARRGRPVWHDAVPGSLLSGSLTAKTRVNKDQYANVILPPGRGESTPVVPGKEIGRRLTVRAAR
jgi:hypothetical protein